MPPVEPGHIATARPLRLSFANIPVQLSLIGCIVLLCNASSRAHVLSYASRKCRRFVRSVISGEVYAFSEAFD